jgi:hypothetical protein
MDKSYKKVNMKVVRSKSSGKFWTEKIRETATKLISEKLARMSLIMERCSERGT